MAADGCVMAGNDWNGLAVEDVVTEMRLLHVDAVTDGWGPLVCLGMAAGAVGVLVAEGRGGVEALDALQAAHETEPLRGPRWKAPGVTYMLLRQGRLAVASCDLGPGLRWQADGRLPLPPRVTGSVQCRWVKGADPSLSPIGALPQWVARVRDEYRERTARPAPLARRSVGDIEAFDRGDSVELARRVLADLRGGSSHEVVYDLGTFWRYLDARGVFVEMDAGHVYRAVAAYAGAPKRTDKGIKGLALSDGAIKGAVSTAKHEAERRGFFADAPRGMVFRSSFVCVERGLIRELPHSPEHRQTHAIDADYAPHAAAACPQWLGMLREVFRRQVTDESGAVVGLDEEDTAECVAALQEFTGAALVGVAAQYAVCMVLHGLGNDGKSRVLSVLRSIFPRSSVSHIAPQEWGRSFLVAGLAGMRLNVVNELPEREIVDGSRFKAIVAGDPITAEHKNRDPFGFCCEAGQVFACNELPPTRDQTRGFWRRWVVLACDRSFEAHEEIRDIDKQVIAAELAAVAAWAIEGAARLQRSPNGYTVPRSATAAKEAWQEDSDQVRQWVAARCAPAEGREESTIAELYPAYRLWAQGAGHHPVAQNKLAARLKGLGYEHRTKVARLYRLRAVSVHSGGTLAAFGDTP